MSDSRDSLQTAAQYDVSILVADDDALARFILADQLDMLGCRRVDTAADGQEALQLALSCAYDLVITDLCMPQMGGQALLAALRAHGQAIPVIAGTAWCEPASTRPCAASRDGASRPASSDNAAPYEFAAVLRKPFAMTQLRALLDAHLCGSPLGRSARVAAEAPRRALYAAFAAAWPDDESALRAALASRDEQAVLAHLHRLQGTLAVLGETKARQACARMQLQIRRRGIEPSAGPIERFVRQCADIACRPPRA